LQFVIYIYLINLFCFTLQIKSYIFQLFQSPQACCTLHFLQVKDEVLAVGMVDGLVSIQRCEEPEPPKQKVNKIARAFGRRLPKDPADMAQAKEQIINADVVVEAEDKPTLGRSDQYLRTFRYKRALDAAFVPYNQKRRPDLIVAFLQELLRQVIF
jgi:hypothetical protein